MESKTVLVTGIGGNVGQGIIRNILDTNFPIKIIGTNISKLSAGNHWVDSFHIVPYGYAGNYIQQIKKIIEEEKIGESDRNNSSPRDIKPTCRAKAYCLTGKGIEITYSRNVSS